MTFANAECEHIAIENPLGIMSTAWRKPDQIIQPWMFGDPFEKKTCLWLKGLPILQEHNPVKPPARIEFASGKTMPAWYAEAWHLPKEERAKLRSKTFPGIAEQMAEQWGNYLLDKYKGQKEMDECGDYLHHIQNNIYKEDTVSIKKEIFKSILDKFETEELRAYCEDMIELIDDRQLRTPSSTSLRYHNATQCQPGGAIYHILLVGTFMNYLLDLEYIKAKFPKPKQRDCMRIAALLHDSVKLGNGGSKYTVHEHPLLAAKWIEETNPEHNIKNGLKKYISSLVARHSGSWTTSPRSNIELPAPESDDQFYVHLCDLLGSRSNIDMIYTDEQTQLIKTFVES